MFIRGDQVVIQGSMGDVGSIMSGPDIHGGESYYKVSFKGRLRTVLAEDLLRHDENQDPETLLRSGPFGDYLTFARRLTWQKLSGRDGRQEMRGLRDLLYSYKAARTEFHAYQFKPLLKFLASDRRRLLIADEVGLGKTIEAGYILQEERARFNIDRVLVVCPASLRLKWQNELHQRFGEDFEVLNRSSFMQKVLLRPGQAERGMPRLAGIVSLQSLRSNKVIESVEEMGAGLDLLIVDEAHHCRNNETKQHRVVRTLSANSEATVLLTATPVHLGDENLFNLLRLLIPEEFDKFEAFQERLDTNRHVVEAETALRRGGPGWEQRTLDHLRGVEGTYQGKRFQANPLYSETVRLLGGSLITDKPTVVRVQENLAFLNLLTPVMTRTRKREVYPDAAQREAHVVRVDMTADEQEVYELLSSFCFEHYAAASGDFAARFALITLQRQLASSLYATMEYYSTTARADSEVDPEDEEDDATEAEDHNVPAILLDPAFLALVEECAELLRGPDTKLRAVLRILKDQPKVVVFAYFKRSLRYLEKALEAAGIGSVRIDGDVPFNPMEPEADERSLRIKRFRDDPSIQVLLSSEVGSEGLDFQFCHVLVNWDLPWNPMVVEQRIGRLDRLGQKSEKILIFSFSCPGTIEDVILQRLYTRIGVFERTIGVLEPILGQEIRDLREQLFNTRLSLKEREFLVDRRALALAQRARDEERLEGEAASLVGQDEFFKEQIERVRRLGRFVTGEELRILVSEFLASDFPACELTPGRRGIDQRAESSAVGTWRLRVSEPLRDFIRGEPTMARTDPALLHFLHRARGGAVELAFDSDVAVGDSALELVTTTHPLVRAIVGHYDRNASLVHPVTALSVSTSLVPPGEYLFLWAAVVETGLRAGRSLWTVLQSADGTAAPDQEDAEAVLHQMVLQGKPWDEFQQPPREFTEQLLNRAIGLLLDRRRAYAEAATRRNASQVEQRLASLDASYKAKRGEGERRLKENEDRQNLRVIPAFKGQLAKLEAEYEEQCRLAEQRRSVTVTWQIEGGGYVRVVPEVS